MSTARTGTRPVVGAAGAGQTTGLINQAPCAALFTALLIAGLTGCAVEPHRDRPAASFEQRLARQSKNGVTVQTAALGSAESAAVFRVALNDVGVQPVFLRIRNARAAPQLLFPIASDPDYFPPYEVARRAARVSDQSAAALYHELNRRRIALTIPPGATREGFLYLHSDEGMKALAIELQSAGASDRFHFVVPVPGLPDDYFDLEPQRLERRDAVRDLDREQLRAWLDRLSCCTRDADGVPGDPLNIALVGTLEQLKTALIDRGWDVTAPVSGVSLEKMLSAFVFGSRYRYAPISALYLLNREQDLAFQKSRAIIDERLHLRLWLAPVSQRQRPVWVGQISRDIGVKLTGRLWPPTTHVIDPDVDEARFYLLQDLIAGRKIGAFGYTRGGPSSTVFEPAYNAGNDPYFTDGLRAVFFLADAAAAEARLLPWAYPDLLKPFAAHALAVGDNRTGPAITVASSAATE